MNFKVATLLATLVVSTGAFAQVKAPEPDYTLSGNATLASDYRFRGFTQTNYGPAFQGGFDFAHKSGFYVGNWNSNVGQALYNGASLEMDLYTGFKGTLGAFTYDVGGIYYYYPKSGKDTGNTTKIDNKEIYFGAGFGPVSAKLYYALGDYFKTASFYGAPQSTKGTTYLDLAYSQEIAGLVLGAHYGLLTLRKHDQAQLTQTLDQGGGGLPSSVGDYKISVAKDLSGYLLTAAVIGTSKKGYFGTDLGAAKAAGKTGLVLSVGKTF